MTVRAQGWVLGHHSLQTGSERPDGFKANWHFQVTGTVVALAETLDGGSIH